MLNPIDEAASTTAAAGVTPQPDKQIALSGSTNNAVIYTVPANRVFRGWASNVQSGQNTAYFVWLEANGTSVKHFSGFSAEPTSYKTGIPSPQLTLVAGTSVKNGGGSYQAYVFGVESDA